MNRNAIKQVGCLLYKKRCLLTLLAVLFQALYITSAGALSLQTPTIYADCNHLDKLQHSTIQCLQHCASSTDNYTLNVMTDHQSSFTTDEIPNIVAYFNRQADTVLALSILPDSIPVNHQNSSTASLIYLNTARLRI